MQPEQLSKRVAASLLAVLHERPGLAELVRALLSLLAAEAAPARLFVCGGLIRDLALAERRHGRAALGDLDLLVEGVSGPRLAELLGTLEATRDGLEWAVRVGASFPVWKLKARGLDEPVDLTLPRSRSSFGLGRHTLDVTEPGVDVVEDSRHRDFTVNALYVELNLGAGGELGACLHDFQHGLDDLAAGVIRCVGAAAERFAEDPLRVLRALRFEATLPGFRLHEDTTAAIRRLAPNLLGAVAEERFADELRLALAARPEQVLERLAATGILHELLPEVAALGEAALRRAASRLRGLVERAGPLVSDPAVFAALLLELAGEPRTGVPSTTVVDRVARRLRLPDVRRTTRLVSGAATLTLYPNLESPEATAEATLADAADRPELLALAGASREASGAAPVDFAGCLAAWPPTRLDFGPLADALDLPEGPQRRRLKLALRQSEIDGRLLDAEQAAELARALGGSNSSGSR